MTLSIRTGRSSWRRPVLVVMAAIVSIAAVSAIVALLGHSPALVIATLLRGGLGSRYAISESLVKSIPLLLASLSVIVAFRAGVWNIGAEGQFIVGALGGLVAARLLPAGPFSIVGALAAAAIAGSAWGGLAAWLKLTRNAPEVLTTILLNFVAVHLLGYAVAGPLRERVEQYPQTDPIPAAAFLPRLGESRLHIGFLIAIAAAFFIHWLLYRTSYGIRLRAVGFNPAAARFAGLGVRLEIARATLLSGALAGLAGGVELLGVTHRLFERFASGHGYSAIAVALVAQLHPLAAILSAMFFGAFATGAGELQRSGLVSSAVGVLLQGMVILALLLFASPRVTLRFSGLRKLRFRSGVRTSE